MIGLRAVPLLSKVNATAAVRNMSAISGPPMVKISFAEKLAHGAAITVGVMAMPAWVLVHIRQYRGME